MENTIRKDGITFLGRFIMTLADRGLGDRIPDYVREICNKDAVDDLNKTIKVTSEYIIKLHMEASKKVKP